MRKKITREDVRLGMYIDALEGKWLDHPFWRKRFVLDDLADLAALRSSKVSGVWIDTSKGLDVEADVQLDTASIGVAVDVPEVLDKNTKSIKKCSAEEEMQRAAEVIERAKPILSGLFEDVRMGKVPELSECLPVVEDISSSVARNASAITGLVKLKTQDEYSYMHSVAVCALMAALALELELSEEQVKEAALAGLLHDVGKALMPGEVLNKPGKLTDEEFEIMRQHPMRGFEVLSQAGEVPQSALDVCLYHHERVDGRGYPKGLVADELSLLVRMSAICDVYDAVTSARVYKKAWEPFDALAQMSKWKGHFDETLFRRFVKCIGIYPLGSLVSLQSGRLAVVVEHQPEQLVKPKVKVFYSINAKVPIPVEVLDLSHKKCTDAIVSREAPQKWGFDSKHIEQLWT